MVKEIYQKAKSVLFWNPKKLLEKEMDLVNKDFFFQGTNGEAVLLVHGWTSTAYEVRRLGKYLNENGYTVRAPMLKGHGTVPKDLENVSWEDWVIQLDVEYAELKSSHSKVYLAGTSIGACLSMFLAQKHSGISALVLMATPFQIKLEKMTVAFARLASRFKKYNRKYYPPTFGARNTITRIIAYQSYPIESALQIFELVKATREIASLVKQPTFVIQSLSDHVVSRKSLKLLFDALGSVSKKKKYIRRAYHTFISDIKNENVFEDILDFIKKN